MQAGSYSWRGGEGSQTDLNGDDRKPPARVHDPRYPKNPNATCCDESEETSAIARSQPATGFVYMVNRFYEPKTGRFTQADSLPFDPTQLTNAQNNRWTYCGNDPLNGSDPTGQWWQLLGIVLIIVGAIIGFNGADNNDPTLTKLGIAIGTLGALVALGPTVWVQAWRQLVAVFSLIIRLLVAWLGFSLLLIQSALCRNGRNPDIGERLERIISILFEFLAAANQNENTNDRSGKSVWRDVYCISRRLRCNHINASPLT